MAGEDGVFGQVSGGGVGEGGVAWGGEGVRFWEGRGGDAFGMALGEAYILGFFLLVVGAVFSWRFLVRYHCLHRSRDAVKSMLIPTLHGGTSAQK